jgi:hypothetical protein
MQEHWRKRYSDGPIAACITSAKGLGVVGYHVTNLNKEMTNYICRTFGMDRGKSIYVNVYGETGGIHDDCRATVLLGSQVRITCP